MRHFFVRRRRSVGVDHELPFRQSGIRSSQWAIGQWAGSYAVALLPSLVQGVVAAVGGALGRLHRRCPRRVALLSANYAALKDDSMTPDLSIDAETDAG